MDISGEHQLDVSHNIYKKRLGPDGVPLVEAPPIKDSGMFCYDLYIEFGGMILLLCLY